MSETTNYIDDYFTGALSESARREFEDRCSHDESFAAEVAFYISARQAAREALLQQKRQEWTKTEAAAPMTVVKPTRKKGVLNWIPYVAAACLILVIATYWLFYKPTPQRLADKYVTSFQLSQTMDADHDSIQAGIAELQAGNYQKAISLFEAVRSKDLKNEEAIKYAGYTYLQLHDYDKALQRFRELSSLTNLQSNSGDMFQAITRLQRNAPGDKEAAKLLLDKVVKENEEGSQEAKEILDSW